MHEILYEGSHYRYILCTQAREWIWSLSLDDIIVQFPPEELSATFQSRASVFVTIILLRLLCLNVCFESAVCEITKHKHKKNVWEEKC